MTEYQILVLVVMIMQLVLEALRCSGVPPCGLISRTMVVYEDLPVSSGEAVMLRHGRLFA